MIVALAVVAGVCVTVSVGALLVRRTGPANNEDSRFAHARAVTTSWAVSAGDLREGKRYPAAPKTTDTAD